MKLYFAVLLFAILIPTASFGQVGADSSKTDSVSQQTKQFVDENGNGIDDRMEGKGKRMQRGKARFIDNDGDGICDGRESGLGFRGGWSDGGMGKGGGKQRRGGRK